MFITDAETEKKLTEQQHQIKMLRNNVEAKMETMEGNNKAAHAESESAIERLRTDNVRAIGELRTTIQENARTFLVQMILVVGAGVAILAFILK
ncbi:MAG: hypothetical protein OXE98_07410 [Hyphomicrobiales bacterium]|nr:hypothetical protein [Hyphomicrobiales bacterium]MCY4053692.1 hypothetical protein [Hyphomicrobiales bacterium]